MIVSCVLKKKREIREKLQWCSSFLALNLYMITGNIYNKTGDKILSSSNTSECRQTTNDPTTDRVCGGRRKKEEQNDILCT